MNIQDILKDRKKLPLLIAGAALILIILMVIILLLASKEKDSPGTKEGNNGTTTEERNLSIGVFGNQKKLWKKSLINLKQTIQA